MESVSKHIAILVSILGGIVSAIKIKSHYRKRFAPIDLTRHRFFIHSERIKDHTAQGLHAFCRHKSECLKISMASRYIIARQEMTAKAIAKLIDDFGRGRCVDSRYIADLMDEACESYKGASIVAGVPAIVYDRLIAWHADRFTAFKDMACAIMDSKFYHSKTDQLSAIMDGVIFLDHSIIIDIERCFLELNGVVNSIAPVSKNCTLKGG